MIRQTLIVILFGVAMLSSVFVCGQGQADTDAAPLEGSDSYIPEDLDDAIRHLKETLAADDIEFLKTASKRDLAFIILFS